MADLGSVFASSYSAFADAEEKEKNRKAKELAALLQSEKDKKAATELSDIMRDERAISKWEKMKSGLTTNIGSSELDQQRALFMLGDRPIDVRGYMPTTGKELMDKPPPTDRRTMLAMQNPELFKETYEGLGKYEDVGKKRVDTQSAQFELSEKQRTATVRDNSPKGLQNWISENRDINPEAASFVQKALDAGNVDLATEMQKKMLEWDQQMKRAETMAGYAMDRTLAAKEKPPEAKLGDFDVKIRKDNVIMQNDKVLSAANDLRQMLTSNNPVAQEVMGTKMAKLSGEVGNLAVQEQMQYKGSQALLAKFQQALKRAGTGEMTKENKRYALELVEMYSRTARDVKNSRINSIMQGHIAQTGLPIEQLLPIAEAYGYVETQEDATGEEGWTDIDGVRIRKKAR